MSKAVEIVSCSLGHCVAIRTWRFIRTIGSCFIPPALLLTQLGHVLGFAICGVDHPALAGGPQHTHSHSLLHARTKLLS
eukprot:1694212-Rhodomonas_salina.2